MKAMAPGTLWQGRKIGYNSAAEDTVSCHGLGLIRIALWGIPADFDGWQMGTDPDGNGCCPELVPGGDTLPWGFGIYPGKDITGHSHTDRREV